MAKRTKGNKIKVNIKPEQKAMLAAVQAVPVEKTDETVAANENEPETTVVSSVIVTDSENKTTIEGDAGNAQAALPVELNKKGKPKKGSANTPSPDGRTQQQRRTARLALREKALKEAAAKDWDFYEIPAKEFEDDYKAAFDKAVSHDKAIKARDILRFRQAAVEGAKKTATQELVDAAKAAVTPTAEMDNTNTLPEDNKEEIPDSVSKESPNEDEKPDNTPVAVIADGKEFVVSAAGDLISEREIGETTTVTLEDVEYVLDSKGELVRNDGESHRKFGQRKHQYKCAKYRAEKAENDQAKELESRNGEPPTPSEINKTIPAELDGVPAETTAEAIDAAEESAAVFKAAEDEIKVCDDLVRESEEADAKKKAEENEPATPVTAEEPVQESATSNSGEERTEQEIPAIVEETKAVEPKPAPVEAEAPVLPPVNKPTLVVTNEHTAKQIASAKKFYGAAFNDDNAKLLTQALIWLDKAVEADHNIREKTTGLKVDPRTTYRLALNAALKHEAEAFGGTPQQITVGDINALYGMPEVKEKAA